MGTGREKNDDPFWQCVGYLWGVVFSSVGFIFCVVSGFRMAKVDLSFLGSLCGAMVCASEIAMTVRMARGRLVLLRKKNGRWTR